ncbi:hypothetical protein GCM10009104_26710 [Marinobacterium maritimum]|uniref:2'-5' RNA ligase n=1 Tax=Marinobacterium maritimum TaxID=500162 RepID=A0ABP3TF62_9GAMM
MTSGETHTLATELRDFPEWHQGIHHYAVWALPVEEPLWLERIRYLQQYLAPLLHPGYARQPHITLFACGLVDNLHFSPEQARNQVDALSALNLSTLQLNATGLSTFTTSPWLGVQSVDNRLSLIRRTLASIITEDTPASHYRPHVTLGFYQQAWRLSDIHSRLATLVSRLPPLPPLPINRLDLCYYATKEIQGELTVKDSIELKDTAETDDLRETLDPLEAIKQMRKEQLRVCALKQQADIDRLVAGAERAVNNENTVDNEQTINDGQN